ncbi:MAG: hypothetical protein ABGX16_21145 [Pirellulales bacterium]
MRRIALLAVLVLLHSFRVVEAGWTVTQLTDNSYNDLDPQVSGSNVVWKGNVVTVSADLNLNGVVDGLDLGITLGNFGSSSDEAGGELNGTDPVDGLDLGILLGDWNPASLQAPTAVPEPTAAMLLMSACCLLGLRRRA